MPKINLKCVTGTFSKEEKTGLAEELTSIAVELEQLPDTPFVRGNVWIYIEDYPLDSVFHGGKSGGAKIISIEVNALKGGLDTESKKLMIERFTDAVRKYAGIAEGQVAPVYIVIRDIEESDWGIFGKTTTLHSLRNPPSGSVPLS